MSGFDKDSILFILNSIREDIDSLDRKWESQLKESGVNWEKVNELKSSVDHLNNLVLKGNGTPSILVQINNLHHKIDSISYEIIDKNKHLSAELDHLDKELHIIKNKIGLKSPRELKIEKWKTVGLISGVVALLIPGLVALLEFLLH